MLDTCRTLEGVGFDQDGVTLVDEEREMPELHRDVEAGQQVRDDPSIGQQHAGGLARQPSIDSLLVIEETSPEIDRTGRRRSNYTGGGGSSISSQHRRLSLDSLHQVASSDMEVSPLSSRGG